MKIGLCNGVRELTTEACNADKRLIVKEEFIDSR